MTGFKDLLGVEESCTKSFITYGNGTKGKILGIGNLINDDLPNLNNVLLVQVLTSNLISISQLCDKGMRVNFSKNACVVTNEKDEEIMRGTKTEGNCYLWIPRRKNQTDKLTCLLKYTAKDDLTTVDGRASKSVKIKEMFTKYNVEQNVPRLWCIN
jgi:hypothetical protein